MPALRSVYTVSLLAACLAQAHARAGPSHNEVQRRNQGQGYGQGQGGGYGGGQGQGQDYGQGQGQDYGQGQGQDYGNGGWKDNGDMGKNEVIVTVTLTEMMTVTAPAPVQANVPPVTVTVTAVAPCDSGVVTATAWVTTCPAGTPPAGESCVPCSSGMWPMPPNGGGLGNCPVLTTSIPNFAPGLSSIPFSEAIVTGVAKAAGPPPGAPAGPPSGVPTGPPAGAYSYGGAAAPPLPSARVTEISLSTLVSAAALSAGPAGGIWGAPGALSAEGAGAYTFFLGSTFIMTGSIVPGLSSIPNTMPGAAPAAPTPPSPPAPSAPAVSAGVFASDAAPVVPLSTTTTTSTSTSSPSEKGVTSSSSSSSVPSSPAPSEPPATAVAESATTSIQSAISYGNSGILGIGKRFVVPMPTAWS